MEDAISKVSRKENNILAVFEYVENRRNMGIYYKVFAEELEGRGYRSTLDG